MRVRVSWVLSETLQLTSPAKAKEKDNGGSDKKEKQSLGKRIKGRIDKAMISGPVSLSASSSQCSADSPSLPSVTSRTWATTRRRASRRAAWTRLGRCSSSS